MLANPEPQSQNRGMLPNFRQSKYMSYDQKQASIRAALEQLRNENKRLKQQIWALQDTVEYWKDAWRQCMAQRAVDGQ
jgi:cell division protein FtsB